MNGLSSKELLDYAVAHPYDGTQDIKPYQHQVGDVTMTIYIDTAAQGHLSLTVKQSQTAASFQSILSLLAVPNCRLIEQVEQKGYLVHRYQFELPAVEEERLIAAVPPVSLAQDREQPGWLSLADDECHICHRQLKDPLSIKVKVGSTCRQNIQKAEGKTGTMWHDITRKELEAIWTTYNTYDKRRRERPKQPPPTPEPEPLLFAEPEEAVCTICGERTTDYWYFDSKTKTCKCRPCYRQNIS